LDGYQVEGPEFDDAELTFAWAFGSVADSSFKAFNFEQGCTFLDAMQNMTMTQLCVCGKNVFGVNLEGEVFGWSMDGKYAPEVSFSRCKELPKLVEDITHTLAKGEDGESFSGSELVEWVLLNTGVSRRDLAVELGQELLACNLVECLDENQFHQKYPYFEDSDRQYCIADERQQGVWMSQRFFKTINVSTKCVGLSCSQKDVFFVGENGRLLRSTLGKDYLISPPAPVPGLESCCITSVECGHNFVVALTNSGDVYSWGSGAHGALGHGDDSDRDIPTRIAGFPEDTGVTQIAVGWQHCVAVTDMGKLFVWGCGSEGRLGLGDRKDRFSPVLLEMDSCVSSVSAGYHHTICAVAEIGAIYTWGGNWFGELGLGDSLDRLSPVPIPLFSEPDIQIIRLCTGAFHSLAMSLQGHIFAWGRNHTGQLGFFHADGSADCEDVLVPTECDFLSSLDPRMISAAGDYSFVCTSNFVSLSHDYFTLNRKRRSNSHSTNLAKSVTPGMPANANPSNSQLVDAYGSPSEHQTPVDYTVNNPASISERHREEVDRINKLFKRQERMKPKAPRQKPNRKKTKASREEVIRMDYAKSMWARVLPNWANQKSRAEVQVSVWKVGVPPKLRKKVWPMALRNDLGITKKLYEHFTAKAHQAYDVQGLKGDTGQIYLIGKEETVNIIEPDLARTFTFLSFFKDEGPLNQPLRNLLQTYCFYRPDMGYIQGMSYLAAHFLLYMDEFTAFMGFCNLLRRPFFLAFMSMDHERIQQRHAIFLQLFLEHEPELHRHFEEHMMLPDSYFLDWALSLFCKKLDIKVCSRIWDIVLLYGEVEIYKAAVAVLRCLSSRLLKLDMEQLHKQIKILPKKIGANQLLTAMKNVRVSKKMLEKIESLQQELF